MSTTPHDDEPGGPSGAGPTGQQPQPEYLGSDSPAGPTSGTPTDPAGGATGGSGTGGRRTALVAGAAVAVVAAVGVGAYGVVSLLAGGDSPATAVPANTVAYLSLDLDPSASQKVEAFKILRKFPGIKKELGSQEDLRRAVFEQIQKEGDCADLDYAKDIEPWIGERVAVAAVPDDAKGAIPVLALQVKDEAEAAAGFKALEGCDSTDGDSLSGHAFVGDYALLAETQKLADTIAAEVEAGTLADSSDFTDTMDDAGDPGIVTMYASKDAPAAIAAAMKSQDGAEELFGGTPFGDIESTYQDFEGAAGVVRFRDGAVEAEFAVRGVPSVVSTGDGGSSVDSLPATTAAALSVALRDGWLAEYVEATKKMGEGKAFDDMMRQGEQATGLQLPEDIETMLGDGVTISIDAGTDFEALAESPDPTQVPAGLRIQGDPEQITPIIDKLTALAGPDGDLVQVETGDGQVAVSLSPDYASTLLEPGTLGSSTAFKDVVPEAGRAAGAFFVNFDAGDGWAVRLGDLISDGDPEVAANLEPLDALGISGWQEGEGAQHGLLRLTTD